MTSTSRTALFRSERFRNHDTGEHVENPFRLVAIDRELELQGLLEARPDLPFAAASDESEYAHVIRELKGEPIVSAEEQVEQTRRDRRGRVGDAEAVEAGGA